MNTDKNPVLSVFIREIRGRFCMRRGRVNFSRCARTPRDRSAGKKIPFAHGGSVTQPASRAPPPNRWRQAKTRVSKGTEKIIPVSGDGREICWPSNAQPLRPRLLRPPPSVLRIGYFQETPRPELKPLRIPMHSLLRPLSSALVRSRPLSSALVSRGVS